VKPAVHAEASRAVVGAVSIGIGQAVSTAIGIAMAMLVPRLLCVADYGNWVVYRSVATLLVGLSAVGTSEVVARFYMTRAAAGDTLTAARVFKSVLVARSCATAAAALAGFCMIVRSSSALSSATDGLLLAASIGLQGTQVAFMLLLYGDGRLRSLALVQVAQSATVPLAVLLAHAGGGLAMVPVGCTAGDAAVMFLTACMARPARLWVPGWLSFREHASMFAVGGLIATSNVTRDLITNAAPYLMQLRSYGVEAIGYVGVAARIGGLAAISLAMVGAALFPSLVQMQEARGLDRAQRWMELASRLGVLLIGMALGLHLLLGAWLVPLVFGTQYHDATPVIAIVLGSVAPAWLAGQWSRLALLTRQNAAHPIAAAAFVLGTTTCFAWLPPDPTGLNAAWTLLAGGVLYAVAFAACLWRRLPEVLIDIRPYLLPLLFVIACWPLSRWASSRLTAAAIATAWTIAYAAALLLGGCIRPHELRDIVRALRRR
jgi:O-antigen/teichoic acid export membrane protein